MNDASGLPREGKNLIVVAQVNKVLHFRSFDSRRQDGRGRRREGSAGKSRANRGASAGNWRAYWPPHELSGDERSRLTPVAESVVGSTRMSVWRVVGMLLKANLWEVLAIIGVVQIFLLPVIAASMRVRTIAWIALCGGPSADLALVQLLLRLRQAELDGRARLGLDRERRRGTEAFSG